MILKTCRVKGHHWFRVPLTKQLKRDKAGHGEATINNATVLASYVRFHNNIIKGVKKVYAAQIMFS